MGNKTKNKIPLNKHFLKVLVQFGDHFVIVMWQKYILQRGLRKRFLLTEVPFLAYPKLSRIPGLHTVIKTLGVPEMGLPATKI